MSAQTKQDVNLSGKVIIITGSNCGIGYETALDLAKKGGTVVMACRDLSKANEAAAKVTEQTKSQLVHVLKLDLASLDSIREFAAAFKAKLNRLDILINNAGLTAIPFQKTKDGFEMQMGVMHFGHFYLTYLLFDLLKKSAPSRIINVSSLAHSRGKMNWNSFQSDTGYSSWGTYEQSKLANVLFTNELAARFGKQGVTAVSLHPGVVKTELWREFENNGAKKSYVCLFKVMKPVFSVFAKNSAEGAQTTIYCAVDDKVPQQNGEYFANCKVSRKSKEAKNPENSKKLWAISENLLGIKFE